MKYLFCYGSNNEKQLKERLGRKVEVMASFAEGWSRKFVGFSQKWNGSVATLEKTKAKTVYGLCVLVDDEDLAVMDLYEGRSYKKRTITVTVLNDEDESRQVKAIAYIAEGLPKGQPSKAYLEACAKTVGTFWKNSTGKKVTWKDFSY